MRRVDGAAAAGMRCAQGEEDDMGRQPVRQAKRTHVIGQRWRKGLLLGCCVSLGAAGLAFAEPPVMTKDGPAQPVESKMLAGVETKTLAVAEPKPAFAWPKILDPMVRPAQEVVPQQPPTPTEPGAQPGGSGLLGGQGLPSDVQQALTPQAPAGSSAANPSISSPLADTGVSAARAAEATAPAASGVAGGAQSQFVGASDAGDLITRSDSALGVERQFRSPIATDIRIRGYKLGQIQTFADDQFWFPARNDLDTFLSKIDSGLIQDIVILKGPYTARFGPGFAFLDIGTYPTPRYDGMEWHGRTTTLYKDNGQQFYGRQSVFGGSTNWGTRVSYGQRVGNGYNDGAGFEIPAAYNARDVEFSFGLDPSQNQNLEFGYIRLDQTDVEFPGQIFDTRWLGTDGYRLTYTLKDQYYFDELKVISYYNRTVFTGDAQNSSKRQQIPELDEIGFTGFTNGDLSAFGDQIAVTWGKPKELQWTVGVDVRILSQAINEFDSLFDVPCDLNYPVPRTNTVNAGVFVENVIPASEYLTIKMGGRFDTYYANVPKSPPGFEDPDCGCGGLSGVGDILGTDWRSLDRYYQLGMGYATAELKLSEQVTALGGAGFAMRPPTPTEMYALNPFLAILQQGFTTVQGNPGLNPEKLHQLDLGLRGNFGWFRTGAAGYFSWINDYVTYQALGDNQGKIPLPLSNALNVRFVNTSLATLWGGEAYAEFDLTDVLTPFATLTYVQGEDESRGNRSPGIFANGELLPNPATEPLPGIAPLESRAGLRIHEAGKKPRYGLELAARMVAGQDRVAASLLEQPTGGFTVCDARAYWQPHDSLLVTLGMDNVFDRFYREHLDLRTGRGVYQPGRTTYVGVELRY